MTADAKHASVLKRHTEILDLVRGKGFVTIGDLADHFRVTRQTVRRDIAVLDKDRLLQRYHGGAGPILSTENVAYNTRKTICIEEKRRIAKLVARHIPARSSLFINIGTTTEETARELCAHSGLKVITNNLNVASILSCNETMEIIVAGGLVRHRDCGIVGESAVDFIRQFKVDIGIIGISGIDLDGTLLDFDYREVRAARAIIDNSRKVFLVTDSTKFGRNAMVRLGNLEEIDALFTDAVPPDQLLEVLRTHEVEVHVADATGAAERA